MYSTSPSLRTLSLGVQSLYKFQSRALLLSLISPPSRKCLYGYHLNLYHSDDLVVRINGSGRGCLARLVYICLCNLWKIGQISNFLGRFAASFKVQQ
ncbi:unnamed protein product, partial [Vitis vinifera]